MKFLKFTTYIFFLFFVSILLFYQCANRVPPSGGPRDTIPPSLIYSNPKHQSTNIHTRVYEFNFDERIQLKNLNKQLIITPRIDFDYDTKYGKTNFILVFDENFSDSITYTFNFREAIQDLTEGNPTEDNKFTFSTGLFLDSLSIEGYAIDLLTNDSIKDATVGLFLVNDTVTIFNGSPYYFNESDEEGYYKIENIKNGKYLLYAFEDKNKNLQLDTKNEKYGWITDTIDLQQNLTDVNLKLYNLDLRDFLNVSSLPYGKNFDINLNKFVTEFQVKSLDTTLNISANLVKESKSIRIYNNFENPDSTGIFYEAIDSAKNIIQDTAWVKFVESSRKPEEFSFSITPKNNESILEKYVAEIKFNKPVIKVIEDSIFFRIDTIPVYHIQSNDQLSSNKHANVYTISFNLSKTKIDSISLIIDSLNNEKLKKIQMEDSLQQSAQKATKKTIKQASQEIKSTGLHLYLGRAAFISSENDSSARQVSNHKFIKADEYGSITGSVANKNITYILQLLNRQNNVTFETLTSDNFIFRNIPPGEYRIRILLDKNKNGTWDIGNMKTNEAPEPLYFYKNSEGIQWLTVRANWEITNLIIE